MTELDLRSVDPLIGVPIYGGYVITAKIAEGGMGAIYVATNRSGAKKVVKFLLRQFSREPSIRERFFREGKACQRLSNKKHIVRVDDTLELPDGQLFMVMEWLDGKTLETHLRQNGRLTAHHAFWLLLQTGRGLGDLHEAGLIHRDLKPQNIFIAPDDDNPYHIKLIDLGIAHDSMEMPTGGLRTLTGAAMGTPGYMAPEQYEAAGTVTIAADVYALAVVLFEMVVGAQPWEATDQRVLYHKQRTELPVIPDDVQIPFAWREIILRALSPDMWERPQTVMEFLSRLSNELPGDDRMGILSGAEMMGKVAPRRLRKYPVEAETVRANGPDRFEAPVVNRINALTWEPPRLTVNPRPSPPSSPVSRPVIEVSKPPILAPTVSARPPAAAALFPPAPVSGSSVVAAPRRSATARRTVFVIAAFALPLVVGLVGGVAYRRLSAHAKAPPADAPSVVAPSTPPAEPSGTVAVDPIRPVPAAVSLDAGTSIAKPDLEPKPSAEPIKAATITTRSSHTNSKVRQPTSHERNAPPGAAVSPPEIVAPTTAAPQSSTTSAPSGSAAPRRPFNPEDVAD